MSAVRNLRWDNYKALLGLLMVYGHVISAACEDFEKIGGLYIFIYLFHMPAFLFICGMFAKRAVAENDRRRLISLLMQYLFAKAVRAVVLSLINHEVQRVKLLSETGIPWFALTVMECTLLAMLLKHVKPHYVLVTAIIIGCAAGYCRDIGSYLSLSRTLVYFPYFYLGYMMDRKKAEAPAERKAVKTCAFLFLMVVLIFTVKNAGSLYPYHDFIKGRKSFYYYKDLLDPAALGGVYRMILYGTGFAMVFAFLFLMPKRKIPLISGIGSRTLSIYIFHPALAYIVTDTVCAQEFAEIFCKSSLGAALFYLAVSVLIVLICSVPPLERLVRKLTVVPLVEDEKQKRQKEGVSS